MMWYFFFFNFCYFFSLLVFIVFHFFSKQKKKGIEVLLKSWLQGSYETKKDLFSSNSCQEAFANFLLGFFLVYFILFYLFLNGP